MEAKNSMNRRKFIGTAAATAATITVVPRHVLGGPGFVAPSDKITVANMGCGTQGLREMPGMLQNPDIQVVAVCDVNKFTTDYLDWSSEGIRNSIRRTLENPNWGSNYQGIPGGRDIGKEYVEKMHSSKIILHFLRKANNDLTDSRTYEIPGSDSFMLAERNKEHLRLFKENKEAVFFDSKEELLEKIKYYLKHEKEREKIAEAGYRRCISSGYSYKDRLKYMLNKIEKF